MLVWAASIVKMIDALIQVWNRPVRTTILYLLYKSFTPLWTKGGAGREIPSDCPAQVNQVVSCCWVQVSYQVWDTEDAGFGMDLTWQQRGKIHSMIAHG
jgi:hypothetical protein